jgi:hypothetical protein
MQTAIRTFFEQELAQVGGRDKVVRLGIELSVVARVALSLVLARLTILVAALLANTK